MNKLKPEKITFRSGQLRTPDCPIIPFISGDGIGPDVWNASRRALDAAVEHAYKGARRIEWREALAGERANVETGQWLPEETLDDCREYLVTIKGPLTTPIGGGIRSLNVALRQILDLYVCLRPVRWFQGVPSPTRHPEAVDMVIFRENTEDIYAGIEFASGTPEQRKFLELLRDAFPAQHSKIRFPESSGIGIKPVSQEGTERLVRAAIRYAVAQHRQSVTFVHKGNIMKFTEGAFRNWGYELAEREFGEQTWSWEKWEQVAAKKGAEEADRMQREALDNGHVLVKDVIADIALQQVLTRPKEFDVIATMPPTWAANASDR